MNGTAHLVVRNSAVIYDLSFKHNISIIQGDSGTGKTALCYLLTNQSGVTVEHTTGISVRVMPNIPEWRLLLSAMHNTLIFFDEQCEFVCTKEFADAIKYTDNYYVLITRRSLATLPYSVRAIYTLRRSGKYQLQRETFIVNENISIASTNELRDPEVVITEDSGTGRMFFSACFEKECIAAGGNSRVFDLLKKCLMSGATSSIYVVVDGSAFGAFIAQVVDYLTLHCRAFRILLPESLEWVLLHHSMFDRDAEIQKALSNPYDNIDYTNYFSLEQYFYSVLIGAAATRGISYDKGSVIDATFVTHENLNRSRELLKIDLNITTDYFG